jgi:transposase
MGKNQKNLSIPKASWVTVEKLLQENHDVLEMWNINTVADLFKFCCRLGMKDLEQMIVEFRTVHKTTMDNPQKR